MYGVKYKINYLLIFHCTTVYSPDYPINPIEVGFISTVAITRSQRKE